MTWHVYPLDEFKDHNTDSKECWCQPEYDEEFDVVIHNSLDQREKYETGELKPQ